MVIAINLLILSLFVGNSNDSIKNEINKLLICHHSESIYSKQYIYYYEDKNIDKIKSVDTSYFILVDKMIYQNPYNTERIINKDYAIEVNNKEKRIIVVKNDGDIQNDLKFEIFGINTINLFNNLANVKRENKGNYILLSFIYEIGLYNKVEIEYDPLSCKVLSVTLNYFKNYASSENLSKTAPKVKIVYEFIEVKAEFKNRLKTDSYFTVKNNKLIPVEKYKHYEILY